MSYEGLFGLSHKPKYSSCTVTPVKLTIKITTFHHTRYILHTSEADTIKVPMLNSWARLFKSALIFLFFSLSQKRMVRQYYSELVSIRWNRNINESQSEIRHISEAETKPFESSIKTETYFQAPVVWKRVKFNREFSFVSKNSYVLHGCQLVSIFVAN